jgi:hypothetical protein
MKKAINYQAILIRVFFYLGLFFLLAGNLKSFIHTAGSENILKVLISIVGALNPLPEDEDGARNFILFFSGINLLVIGFLFVINNKIHNGVINAFFTILLVLFTPHNLLGLFLSLFLHYD